MRSAKRLALWRHWGRREGHHLGPRLQAVLRPQFNRVWRPPPRVQPTANSVRSCLVSTSGSG